MPTAADRRDVGAVDCAVHPLWRDPDDIRTYLKEPWRSRAFPTPERYFYPSPVAEYARPPADEPTPGGDPRRTASLLFQERGLRAALLLPATRGLLPELELGSAVCAATNAWLADVWLDSDRRYLGSIRVNPDDPPKAAAEIEHWAEHPQMVQVAVPLQAHAPYGNRRYLPIWQAAARHRLPVAVAIEGGSGVDYWPTAVGYPTHFYEYQVMQPLNFAYHLASLIAEGVFDRLPGLLFVFADGGFDLLAPLIWRMDKNWRPTHHEIPWTQMTPSGYLRDHVRFCICGLEQPAQPAVRDAWLAVSRARDLLMYASHHPRWDDRPPQQVLADADADLRRRLLVDTAAAVYRLPAAL